MKWLKKSAESVEVLGKPFYCPVCSHDGLFLGRAMLNTTVLTFLKLDWANRNAAVITCEKCGHISWFNQQ